MFQTLKICIFCIAILCKLLINTIQISYYFTVLLDFGASDFLGSPTFRFWLKLQRNVNFLLLQKNFISLIFAAEIERDFIRIYFIIKIFFYRLSRP